MTFVMERAPDRNCDVAREMTIRLADPASEPEWDEKLARLAGVTFFHGAAWCNVLKESYGFHPCYVLAENRGVPRGLLPLMEVDNWPKGRRGISLPFTDECPLLALHDGDREEIAAAAMREGRKRGWKYLECRGLPAGPVVSSVSFYKHVLPVERDEKKMFGCFASTVQRAIRKAERSGVTVDISTSLEAMRGFYRLHGRTRRKHGVPPQSFVFFESIYRNVLQRGQGFVVTARLGARAIAAAVFFRFGNKAVYKFGASDERVQHWRGNNLVMWEAIRHLSREGSAELDFGRTSLGNEGLRAFKLGWGTSESRLDYSKYDFASDSFVADRDHASGWHTRIFNRLPSPLARWVGAALYARLA